MEFGNNALLTREDIRSGHHSTHGELPVLGRPYAGAVVARIN
jgi:hypothetical protein